MAYKGFKGIGPNKYGSPLKFEPVGENIISDEEASSETIDTNYGEQDVIASDMTTGRSGHLDEVVLTAGPREKTRVEHRLDKTEEKAMLAAEAGNDAKAARLQARQVRLQNRADRQEGRDKKKYARKDKKFWRNQ